ncbi:MAG: NAD(P)-dependent oxidoreductase [Pseudomonadota bacterium]
MKKIVLTGAAGALGASLRAALSKRADALVSTDIAEVADLLPNETFVQADLADYAAMAAIIDGADMVVHFGALVDEAPFDDILGPNIIGAYNVWEAAWRTGARRVVYASSIHAVGMYEKTEFVGVDDPHRPDGFYGLAKCFSEDLARMYWEKRGLEAVCLRILSCTPEPTNSRAIGSWLSHDDMLHLVDRAITTPVVGFTIAYGVSANDRSPVDNAAAAVLGYRPKDNAEDWAEAILAASSPADPTDLSHNRHGGPFAAVKMGESGIAQIKAMSVKTGG